MYTHTSAQKGKKGICSHWCSEDNDFRLIARRLTWNKARNHSNLIPFASEARSENTLSSEQLLPSLLLCAFSQQHTTADARVSAKEWKPGCNGSFAIRHQDSGCSGDSMLVTEWERETFLPQTMGQLHLHP